MENIYTILESLNRVNEGPFDELTKKAKGLLTKKSEEDTDTDSDYSQDIEDLERQNREVRQGLYRPKSSNPKGIDDCHGDPACIEKFSTKPELKPEPTIDPAPEWPKKFSRAEPNLMKVFGYYPYAAAGIELLNYILQNSRRWLSAYPGDAIGELMQIIMNVSSVWHDSVADKKNDTIEIDGPGPGAQQGYTYYIPKPDDLKRLANVVIRRAGTPEQLMGIDESLEITEETNDELVELIAREAYIKMPEIFKAHGDEYIMSLIDEVAANYANGDASIEEMLYALAEKIDGAESGGIHEGAATVFSDHAGHHLKNADGEVVQSFDKTAEGLRAARNALYANYNVLSMEKPKESTMNEFEDKFNTALNESLTVNTTAGTDQPDTVNVTATDEDAHTLVAILKAAGLPYKEQEAKIVAATPCGEQVEEEYANEPDEKTMSTDFMVNKLAGGLNRQKQQFKKEYPGDNPMAVNEENLMRGLWDLYKKV